MKNVTSTEQIASAPQYIALRSGIALKLGKHADGCINYTAACDPDRTKLFVTITDNSSGGYFSREYVPVDRIEELLVKLDQLAFPSKALKAAFTGKSSNNAGFLAAILHTEGLLARATGNEAKHVLSGDWTKWKVALLALEGSPAASLSTDIPRSQENCKTFPVKRTKPANSNE